MARARTRWIIARGLAINGVDLTGQLVVEMGRCNCFGTVSKKKRVRKADREYLKLRIEDTKFLRKHGIKDRFLTMYEGYVSDFLREPEPGELD